MRQSALIALLVLGIGGVSTQAQAACNVRGEYCGYPGWAANAFSHPRDRVPDRDLDNPTNKWAGEQPAPRYQGKRPRTRYR